MWKNYEEKSKFFHVFVNYTCIKGIILKLDFIWFNVHPKTIIEGVDSCWAINHP
jgi:hypothetical protein